MKELLAAIEGLEYSPILDLSNLNLNSAAVKAIVDQLIKQQKSNIRILRINRTALDAHTVSHMLALRPLLTKLHTLDLVHCQLDTEAASMIGELIKENLSLRVINLSDNPFYVEGAIAVAQALQTTAIEKLIFSGIPIRTGSALNDLAKSLKIPSLFFLDLSECFNFIGKVKEVVEGCPLLQSLYIGANRNVAPFNKLINLAVEKKLTDFDIEYPELRDWKLSKLGSAMGNFARNSVVQNLVLNRYDFSRSVGIEFLNALSNRKNSLQSLIVRDSTFEEKGISALCAIIKNHGDLRKLKFNCCNTSDKNLGEIVKTALTNTKIREFSFNITSFDEKTSVGLELKKISEIKNQTLTKFSMDASGTIAINDLALRLKAFPEIIELDLRSSVFITDISAWSLLFKNMPKLQKLSLSAREGAVFNESNPEIWRFLRSLKELHLGAKIDHSEQIFSHLSEKSAILQSLRLSFFDQRYCLEEISDSTISALKNLLSHNENLQNVLLPTLYLEKCAKQFPENILYKIGFKEEFIGGDSATRNAIMKVRAAVLKHQEDEARQEFMKMAAILSLFLPDVLVELIKGYLQPQASSALKAGLFSLLAKPKEQVPLSPPVPSLP